jgi:hypothetical protein
MGWRPKYTESEIRDAVQNSPSLAASLRRLGLRAGGGNPRTLKRHIAHYGVSIQHFNPNWALRGGRVPRATPLEAVLVEESNYSRGALKRRLYESGLKTRACELCGQDEMWRGRPMALILDHINGIGNDNRIENLQIVCPNCAATLDTHCGRRNRIEHGPRACVHCGNEFRPSTRASVSAAKPAASTVREVIRRGRRPARSSARGIARSSRRRGRSASAPWVGSTGCPTTPCANGCNPELRVRSIIWTGRLCRLVRL